LTLLFQEPFGIMRTICSTIIDEDLASSIVAISQSTGVIFPILAAVISDEIHKEVQVTALFRTDSMSTKLMRRFALLSGYNWLNLMIGDIVRRIVANPGTFEIDPNKLPPGQNIEANLLTLKLNTNQFIESV